MGENSCKTRRRRFGGRWGRNNGEIFEEGEKVISCEPFYRNRQIAPPLVSGIVKKQTRVGVLIEKAPTVLGAVHQILLPRRSLLLYNDYIHEMSDARLHLLPFGELPNMHITSELVQWFGRLYHNERCCVANLVCTCTKICSWFLNENKGWRSSIQCREITPLFKLELSTGERRLMLRLTYSIGHVRQGPPPDQWNIPERNDHIPYWAHGYCAEKHMNPFACACKTTYNMVYVPTDQWLAAGRMMYSSPPLHPYCEMRDVLQRYWERRRLRDMHILYWHHYIAQGPHAVMRHLERRTVPYPRQPDWIFPVPTRYYAKLGLRGTQGWFDSVVPDGWYGSRVASPLRRPPAPIPAFRINRMVQNTIEQASLRETRLLELMEVYRMEEVD